MLFHGALWAVESIHKHPLGGTFNKEKLNKYEYETEGDSYLQSCAWEDSDAKPEDINIGGINIPGFDIDEAINKIIESHIPKVDGICENLNREAILGGNYAGKDKKILAIIKAIKFLYEAYFEAKEKVGGEGDNEYTYLMGGMIDFVGKEKAGSTFDLGAFAKCDVNQSNKIEDMLLSKFCAAGEDGNLSFSPASVLAAHTVDAMGLPSYGGKDGNSTSVKKVNERKYPSRLTGKQLFDDNGTNPNGKPDGGFLLAEADEDPYGSTAVALNSFDKATIVLKTLAIKAFGTSDANATTLPATKAQSMDQEDEIVQLEVRMSADLNQFGDTLTRALRKELLEKTNIKAWNWKKKKSDGSLEGPHLASHASYVSREKNVTANFFKSKKSGLAAIYKGIEDEAKARMASEMLIMTADPNYIADPSEARAALVKPAQRNKFRYAALIQQEKNKMLKLKYASIIKRKQQMVDLIKQQAYIRASIFRDEIAKHELQHILNAADESVSVSK